MHSVRSSSRPVFSATGITVFCVPFFASTSQAKPTHQRQRMHAGLPLYGTELRSIGIWNGCSPIRRAALSRMSNSRPNGVTGGIGSGFCEAP